MKKMILGICIVTLFLIGSGCTKDSTLDVSLEDILTALDEAGIQYSERTESGSAYDIQREGAERYLYEFESGNLTVYIFPDVAQRRGVQRDPFPTAGAEPPDGSYGIGRILVFYYDGDAGMAQKLKEALKF